MKNYKSQNHQSALKKVLITIFAVGFVFSLFSTFNAFAAANLFKIQNAELTEISATSTGEVSSFTDSTITTSLVFHKVNDSAKYTITLKNMDDKSHVIESITDNNTNAYINYIYDSYADTEINSGTTFDFVITVKYASGVTDMAERTQATENVKFSIKYLDVEEPDEFLAVPNTGANTNQNIINAIQGNTIALVIFTVSLITCIIIICKNHKKYLKPAVAIVVAISAVATITAAKAITTEVNTITFTASYGLYDKVVVTYDTDGTKTTQILNYGENIAGLQAPASKVGYTTDGWTLDGANIFDPATPITEDITLTAKRTPITYTINFDKNSSAATGTMEPIQTTYDTSVDLTDNGFTNAGYTFAGWATTPTGDVAYEDGDSVKNLTDTANATITLYAKWEKLLTTINMVGNGRSFSGDTDGYTLKLDGSCTSHAITNLTAYSHSDNINDAGESNGNYSTDLATKDTVTINGASGLRIDVTYGIENYYDVLYIYKGIYEGNVTRYNTNYSSRLTGNDNSPAQTTIYIDGDTATFAFYSDNRNTYYGYYAVVTALDSSGNAISRDMGECERTLISGEYEEPIAGNFIFSGWSEDPDAINPHFYNSAEIINNFYATPGEEKTLYAIWTQLYEIVYDGNDSTSGTMSMATNDNLRSGDVALLYAPNFIRSGYGFVGWSTDKNALPNSNSTIYGPNQEVALDEDLNSLATNDGQIKLYAIWTPTETSYTLQDFNATAFEAVNPNKTITALTDTRDGQTYAVAKLADGKWWMIENLRLDPAGLTLDSTNTNDPTTAFANLAKNRTTSTSTTCDDDSAACINQYSVHTGNIGSGEPSPFDNGNHQWYGYGVYYNWYTATAGNGTYSLTDYASAAGDICPAGWQLPTNAMTSPSTSDWGQLDLALGGTGFPLNNYGRPTPNEDELEANFPVNTVHSGRVMNGVAYWRGQQGQFWGKNAAASNYDGSYYNADNYNGHKSASMGTGLGRYTGLAIRCLKK